MEKEKVIFKSKHTFIVSTLFYVELLGFLILSIIPFLELQLSEINFKIVLYELFIFLMQIAINFYAGNEIIYCENKLIISQNLIFITIKEFSSKKIQGYSFDLLNSYKFNLYRFNIKYDNKIYDFKFIELNKETIKNIGTIKINKENSNLIFALKNLY